MELLNSGITPYIQQEQGRNGFARARVGMA